MYEKPAKYRFWVLVKYRFWEQQDRTQIFHVKFWMRSLYKEQFASLKLYDEESMVHIISIIDKDNSGATNPCSNLFS